MYRRCQSPPEKSLELIRRYNTASEGSAAAALTKLIRSNRHKESDARHGGNLHPCFMMLLVGPNNNIRMLRNLECKSADSRPVAILGTKICYYDSHVGNKKTRWASSTVHLV
ncbi:hypothetical protein DAPPUDRAFT_259910 [Daphnia pulex]|uniref:Uncharacterized protein n=1 Tax=Daphnia pulex TaxID=6669 RepID=E9HI42_DAPPU|nr:hypothetical protein DAPPUDRAFT_259910 [Daphnia pulex]|eukprot:EFX68591.1 hypothetical protein DAPPUDRAFT_259910 [Daphnia pulex]